MKKRIIKNIAIDAMFLALLCCCAFSISIDILKFTLQLLFVFIMGLLLPIKNTLIVLICYIILGLIGLPVFAGYNGGLQYIYNPTFGFVYGFIPGVVALELVKKWFPKSEKKALIILKMVISCVSCQIICYVFGFLHGYYILNITKELNYTFYQLMMLFIIPYIPIDILKFVIAIIVVIAIQRPYKKIICSEKNDIYD